MNPGAIIFAEVEAAVKRCIRDYGGHEIGYDFTTEQVFDECKSNIRREHLTIERVYAALVLLEANLVCVRSRREHGTTYWMKAS